jgi:hypothetical protein
MSLCEALHARVAMAGVEAPWPVMGSSPEKGRRGKGKRRRGAYLGAAWGGGGLQGGTKGTPLSARGCCCSACSLFHAEREVEGKNREKEKKKEKGKKKRRKKFGKFSEI